MLPRVAFADGLDLGSYKKHIIYAKEKNLVSVFGLALAQAYAGITTLV